MAIVRGAHWGSAGKFDLVRAATAAIRAVALPEQEDVLATLDVIESWLSDPSKDNLLAVDRCRDEMLQKLATRGHGDLKSMEADQCVVAAETFLCFACSCDGIIDQIVFATVEFASTAAAFRGINLRSVVTAALL